MTILLLINLAATLFLTGIAWSLQFVQLPMLRPEDASRHRRLNTRLVIFPMLVEAITTIWLVIENPSPAIVAGGTFWIGMAIGTIGYTLAHSRGKLNELPRWNLLRTFCWTARVAILVSIII